MFTIIGDKLAKNLAQSLQYPFISVKEIIFPDGEVKPILENENISKKGVVFLQKKEKENINSYLVKLYLLLEKLSSLSKELFLIIPYFPYARQDTIFKKGEPLSSYYIIKLLEKNVSGIITINYHQHRQKIENLSSKKVENISVFSYFKNKLKKIGELKENSIIIGPDEESEFFVKDFIGDDYFPFYIFKKIRDLNTGKVKFLYDKKKLKEILEKKQEAIIVDDIVSSAQTIKKIKDILLSLNKNLKLKLVFVHSILGNQTIFNLKKLGFKKIYTTNTIENRYYFLDINEILKEKIIEIFNFKK